MIFVIKALKLKVLKEAAADLASGQILVSGQKFMSFEIKNSSARGTAANTASRVTDIKVQSYKY